MSYRWNWTSSNPFSRWPKRAASAAPRARSTPPSPPSAGRSAAWRASSARGSSSATAGTWNCTFNGQLLLPLAQAIVARTEDAISLMKEQAGRGRQHRAAGGRRQRVRPGTHAHPRVVPGHVSQGDGGPHREGRRRPRGGGHQRRTRLRGHHAVGLQPGRHAVPADRGDPPGGGRRTTGSPRPRAITMRHARPRGHPAAAGHHERRQHRGRRHPPGRLRAQVLLPRQLPGADKSPGTAAVWAWRPCPRCWSRRSTAWWPSPSRSRSPATWCSSIRATGR